ncbi:MAG TPA: hypothetical protein DIS66_08150 [Candidatus Omnitrophica bacterium]|nr:hypothetical protein [Candidatus Omnitrophota bacterium]
MNLTDQFYNQAKLFLSDLGSAMPVKEIEEKFREKKMIGPGLSSPDFQKIYYAYLTAQVSQRWSYCCYDQRIDSKEIQNLFFKSVLDHYAAAKDVESATHFSEALYAANSAPEQHTLISILTAFFKKVGADAGGDVTAEHTAELFHWVAGVWDGYCSHFENSFDDFLAELRLKGTLSQGKRG